MNELERICLSGRDCGCLLNGELKAGVFRRRNDEEVEDQDASQVAGLRRRINTGQ